MRRKRENEREEKRQVARKTRLVLGNVRRRKAEVHEAIKKIQSLERLREFRHMEAQEKGEVFLAFR